MGEPAEVNMHEAETHISQLLARVRQGEEITISESGHPIARIVPAPTVQPHREPGVWRGRVVIHDDFDELPEDIAEAFAGRRP